MKKVLYVEELQDMLDSTNLAVLAVRDLKALEANPDHKYKWLEIGSEKQKTPSPTRVTGG